MLRRLVWLCPLIMLAACVHYAVGLNRQLDEVTRKVAVVQSTNPLESRLAPVEEALSALQRLAAAREVRTLQQRQAPGRRRLLRALQGRPVQALEFDDVGFYVETPRAPQVRLSGFPKLSVEPGRLAGRWP